MEIFKQFLLYCCLLACCFVLGVYGIPAPSKPEDIGVPQATSYLTQYGYLMPKSVDSNTFATINSTKTSGTSSYNDQQIEQALKEYQKFMGLPVTGLLDDDTKLLMSKPRCGHKDVNGQANNTYKVFLTSLGRRKRRLASLLTNVYGRRDLKYTWTRSRGNYEKERGKPGYYFQLMLDYAFNIWPIVTNLFFINMDYYNSRADVMIYFYTGNHGDGFPFDGPGGHVAHANAAKKQIHLDDTEYWERNSYFMYWWRRPGKTPDFIQTVAHEIGHLLGLSHESSNTSIMYATVDGGIHNDEYRISTDDIARIQALYGKCWPERISVAFSNLRGDGLTYFLVGPLMYRIDNSKIAAVKYDDGFPLAFYHYMRGGFEMVDDIVHSNPNIADNEYHLVYFLRGWYGIDIRRSFSRRAVRIGWNPISKYNGWPGLNVDKIDAAFRHVDNRLYIFRKHLVYRWDYNAGKHLPFNIPVGTVEAGWPKNISEVFPGLPNDIDTAFKWNYDNTVYFFKGEYFYIWLPKENRADGLYSTDQWKDICDVRKCSQFTKKFCRSQSITTETCWIGTCAHYP